MLETFQKDDMPLATHAFHDLLCLQVVCPWKWFLKSLLVIRNYFPSGINTTTFSFITLKFSSYYSSTCLTVLLHLPVLNWSLIRVGVVQSPRKTRIFVSFFVTLRWHFLFTSFITPTSMQNVCHILISQTSWPLSLKSLVRVPSDTMFYINYQHFFLRCTGNHSNWLITPSMT